MTKTFILLVVVAVLLLLVLQPGGFLIDTHPEKSDVIVVLAGDQNDVRYWRGLDLLRKGYGQHLLLDAGTGTIYGHSVVELASEFIARTAGANAAQVSVCPVEHDSTKEETGDVAACFAQFHLMPRSVLLVSSDYHTRRALSIFRNRLPQYRWSAAGASDSFFFGQPWWRSREWAKTYLSECEKLVYWELVDRWRK